MKSDKLQDAIGEIREEYIAEAHEQCVQSVKTDPESSAGSAKESASPAGIAGNSTGVSEETGSKVVSYEDAAQKGTSGKSSRRKVWSTVIALAACLAIVATVSVNHLLPNRMGSVKTESAEVSEEAAEEADETEKSEGVAATSDEPLTGDEESAASEEISEDYDAATGEESALPEETADVDDGMALADTEESGESAAASEAADDGAVYDEEWWPEPGQEQADAFILTAGEWNDNENWPFFVNLVNAGLIEFPAYGIDPRFRTKVTVEDQSGRTLEGETVELLDERERVLWTAKTDQNGVAYLFSPEGKEAYYVLVNGKKTVIPVPVVDYEVSENDSAQNGQGGQNRGRVLISTEEAMQEVTVTTSRSAQLSDDLQVMFILDTTGSMTDELAYLQRDFASIAQEVGTEGIRYSVNFYRDEGDEYVTKCNGFIDDVASVQSLLNAEYADGGGDEPEAVAQILEETITNNKNWRDDCTKIAFLIFDAPPHRGQEQRLAEAVEAAAEKGIHLIPVVASNAARETELFGRALAICTNGDYVFLTDDSGVGNSHLEPIVGDYDVELLHDVIVRIIKSYK